MQALRFYGSFNVTVTGITIQNSQQCHLKFDNCIGVTVYNFTVSSPGDSPNTDGIHLQNSKDVLIRSSNIACGKIPTLNLVQLNTTNQSKRLEATISSKIKTPMCKRILSPLSEKFYN